MNDKISIVLACCQTFNRANTLSRVDDTIKSIAAQTHKNFECIVVSDVDIKTQKDKRFTSIKLPGKNISELFNAGLRAATGEYIMFMFSNEFLTPSALDVLLHNAKMYNAQVVSGSANLNAPEDFTMISGDNISPYGPTGYFNGSHEYMRHNPQFCSMLSAKLFRKDIVTNALFFADLSAYSASAFTLYILHRNPKVLELYTTTHYIMPYKDMDPDNPSAKDLSDFTDGIERVINILQQKFPSDIDHAIVPGFAHTLFIHYLNMYTDKHKLPADVRRKLWKFWRSETDVSQYFTNEQRRSIWWKLFW